MFEIVKVSVGSWFFRSDSDTINSNNYTHKHTHIHKLQLTLAGQPTTELRPEVCRLRRAQTNPVLI